MTIEQKLKKIKEPTGGHLPCKGCGIPTKNKWDLCMVCRKVLGVKIIQVNNRSNKKNPEHKEIRKYLKESAK